MGSPGSHSRSLQFDTDTGMSKPGRRGLARILAATRYSWKGFRAAWMNEEAFRIEATLGYLRDEELIHRDNLVLV